VRLRYRAFPASKFGHHRGTVVSISRHALDVQSVALLAPGTPAPGSAYRLLVELDRQYVQAYGARRPLIAGMLVEADIIGERRKLYEWLLEPLYSVTGRL
jgi:membrane fusion protein